MAEQIGETLPAGWQLCCMDDGRMFFINDILKITSWLHPITKEAFKTGFLPYAGLPAGWETGISEGGKIYYINHLDRSTSWLPPIAKRKTMSSISITPCKSNPIYVNLCRSNTQQIFGEQLTQITKKSADVFQPKILPIDETDKGADTVSSPLQPPPTGITDKDNAGQKGTGKKLASSLAKFFKGGSGPNTPGGAKRSTRARKRDLERVSDITLIPPRDTTTISLVVPPGTDLPPATHSPPSFPAMPSNPYGIPAPLLPHQPNPAEEHYPHGWLFFLENEPVTHWVKKWATLEGAELSIYKTCPPLDREFRQVPLTTVRFITTLRHSKGFQNFVTYQEFSIKIPCPAPAGLTFPGDLAGTPTTTMYSFALQIEIYHVMRRPVDGRPDKLMRSATKLESITMATATPYDRDVWVRAFTSIISSARLYSLSKGGEILTNIKNDAARPSAPGGPSYDTSPRKRHDGQYFRSRAKTEISSRPSRLVGNAMAGPIDDPTTTTIYRASYHHGKERLIDGPPATVTTPEEVPRDPGRSSPLRDDLVLLLIRNRRELKRLQAQMETASPAAAKFNPDPTDGSGSQQLIDPERGYAILATRIERYERAIKTLEALLFQADTSYKSSNPPHHKFSRNGDYITPPQDITFENPSKNWELSGPINYDSDYSPGVKVAKKVLFSPLKQKETQYQQHTHLSTRLISTSLQPRREPTFSRQIPDRSGVQTRARLSPHQTSSPTERHKRRDNHLPALRQRFKELVSSAAALTIDRNAFEERVRSLVQDLSSGSTIAGHVDAATSPKGPAQDSALKLRGEVEAFVFRARQFYETQEGLKRSFVTGNDTRASDVGPHPLTPADNRHHYMTGNGCGLNATTSTILEPFPMNGSSATPPPNDNHVIMRRHGIRDTEAMALRLKRSLSLPPATEAPEEPARDYANFVIGRPNPERYATPKAFEAQYELESQRVNDNYRYVHGLSFDKPKPYLTTGHVQPRFRSQVRQPFGQANRNVPRLLSTPKIQRQAANFGLASFESDFPDIVRSSVLANKNVAANTDSSPSVDQSASSFGSFHDKFQSPPNQGLRRFGASHGPSAKWESPDEDKDFNLGTIDQELCKPDKICIPFRLGQRRDPNDASNNEESILLETPDETEEEKAQKTLKKEYLRNLLSNYNIQDMYEHIHLDHNNSNAPYTTGPPHLPYNGGSQAAYHPSTDEEEKRFKESCREERLRRQRLLSLNEMLAKEVVAKSRLMMAKSNRDAKNRF